VPTVWMFFAASRFPSQWFNLGAPLHTVSSLDGSSFDLVVFAALIALAAAILARRCVPWGVVALVNAPVFLYFAFGAVSVTWSDYPFVSFKRLIKASGNVLMVLVVLTELKPYNALELTIRRLSFVLLPLSLLFIKYYPHLGRTYHMGEPLFTGVATHKNGLGQLSLIAGVYFLWRLVVARRKGSETEPRSVNATDLLLLGLALWLLNLADSATSTACVAVAAGVFLTSQVPALRRRPKTLVPLSLLTVAVVGMLEGLLNITDKIILMLGRRPDLTTRVPMWNDLISMVSRPMVGYGYESFWLGTRQNYMAEVWGITGQAHNGYLEMYLNLGLVGVGFIIAWALLGLGRVTRLLPIDYSVAVLNFSFLVVVLLYNWTEATFYGVSIMWMLLLLAIMRVPQIESDRGVRTVATKHKRKTHPRPFAITRSDVGDRPDAW